MARDALAIDERDDLVEVLSHPVHGDALLRDGTLEVVLRDISHDLVSGRSFVDLNHGFEDALGKSALVADKDRKVGEFGGF